MTELTNDSSLPVYENELSNFKRETLEKIKEFRSARNNWTKTYSSEIINTSMKKGLYKSDEYKGRCALLRRIRFKTTFLRVHHKTIRPLKLYTFKQKLSDTEIDRVINQSLEKLKSTREKSKSKICTRKYANLAPDDNLQGEKSGKNRKSKKKKIDNFIVKKFSQPKKCTKKLQDSKLERVLVDSCKCESGKGLTVVIKGVCLCDKSTLNKLNLGEICNEYSKLENKNAEPAKLKLSRTTDSLELHKKKMSQYHLEKQKKQKEGTITPTELPLEKHVKFKKDDNGSKLIKDENVCTQKSASTNTKSAKTPLLKWNGFKEECKQNISKKKDQKKNNKINVPESHTKENLISERNKGTEDLKEKTKTNDDNDSTVMLYKNKPEEQSNLGLTEEQYQKMNEILKQKSKKLNKENL